MRDLLVGGDFRESPRRAVGDECDDSWSHRSAGGKPVEIDRSISEQHWLADYQAHPGDPSYCQTGSLPFSKYFSVSSASTRAATTRARYSTALGR